MYGRAHKWPLPPLPERKFRGRLSLLDRVLILIKVGGLPQVGRQSLSAISYPPAITPTPLNAAIGIIGRMPEGLQYVGGG